MEAVNYFAPEGEELYETPSFRRSNAFEATAAEVKAVREAVGINEIHNFGKYLVTGLKARDWLDVIMAGRIPKQGRLSLTPMLSPKGRLIGDFTVTCLAEDRFQLTASYGAQAYHLRWFEQNLWDGVTVENISTRKIGFQIAGPNARALLAKTTRANVSAEAFRFMDAKEMDVGLCRALVQRVSYTGDLGFEVYVGADDQRALCHTLAEAGADLGLRPFGMRAMMSLRLDKFFGSWLREFGPDYMPAETGMDRFTSYNKPSDWIGKAAAMAEKSTGPSRKICAFEVDAKDADVVAYEPIFVGGEVVGFCTSGGYSHYAEKSIALGFVPTEMISDDLEVEIEILGEMCRSKILTAPLFDADGARMRG
jgi:dimethylglycine dehydrogenase